MVVNGRIGVRSKNMIFHSSFDSRIQNLALPYTPFCQNGFIICIRVSNGHSITVDCREDKN
jgi:hypothetical protein